MKSKSIIPKRDPFAHVALPYGSEAFGCVPGPVSFADHSSAWLAKPLAPIQYFGNGWRNSYSETLSSLCLSNLDPSKRPVNLLPCHPQNVTLSLASEEREFHCEFHTQRNSCFEAVELRIGYIAVAWLGVVPDDIAARISLAHVPLADGFTVGTGENGELSVTLYSSSRYLHEVAEVSSFEFIRNAVTEARAQRPYVIGVILLCSRCQLMRHVVTSELIENIVDGARLFHAESVPIPHTVWLYSRHNSRIESICFAIFANLLTRSLRCETM